MIIAGASGKSFNPVGQMASIRWWKLQGNIWTQNQYRIKKKVLALTNVYWIEDWNGTVLGFSKQKMLKIKEDIRIWSDDSMGKELFRIQQENIGNDWGTFAIIDSDTGTVVGKLRRSYASNFVHDEYHLLDANGQQFGRVAEETSRGLVRKFVPFGGLVPEQVCVEINGQKICQIKQQFKVVGDTWEVDCSQMPVYLDRRVLLASMLMMGMVERQKK